MMQPKTNQKKPRAGKAVDSAHVQQMTGDIVQLPMTDCQLLRLALQHEAEQIASNRHLINKQLRNARRGPKRSFSAVS